MVGNFNIHIDSPAKPEVVTFMHTTSSDNLQQHVTGPTHIMGHTLDLAFTRCSDALIDDCYVHEALMSDHHVVCTTVDIAKGKPLQALTSMRKYRNIDNQNFSNSVIHIADSFNHCQRDTDSSFEWYNKELIQLLDSVAPLTVKSRILRSRMPWYNKDIHIYRRKRRRAERKWLKTRSLDDREMFLNARRITSNLICRTKIRYCQEKLSSCDARELYKTLDSLLHRNPALLPVHDCAETLSNKFCSFFSNKIMKIRQNLQSRTEGAVLVTRK